MYISHGATQRPAKLEHVRRLPQGFFDDPQDGIQTSTIPITHVRPSASRRRGFTASLDLRPHALLNQLSSLFRRSQRNTGVATTLQQLPRQNVSSRHRPSVIDVATAQDKQTLYVARRPERPGDKGKQTQQQQGQSQSQAQVSTSQTPLAGTTTSTSLPQVTTVGAAAAQSRPATTVIQQQRCCKPLLPSHRRPPHLRRLRQRVQPRSQNPSHGGLV
ncbi:hypothetical protein AZE42_02635 [Rhizopogon vesiculosus]|uniref:Uncharacterized protein n=1 Tax=Rhizopogon vesiculosus TaxID=180088 RepID=A0A1J8Q5I5_9AGAM|nr:hypothetical protein AZE42_02635 [Rhizopogon vesiculosus]